jgi:diaminohydroxyphosphoribosylaminopyrimidine deaminase/5-amino-6-(5-phosphoribosylamino)uracil reductase
VVVFTGTDASPDKIRPLEHRGIQVIPLSRPGKRVAIAQVLSWLGSHEIASVLVEGGSLLFSSIFEEKLADKIFLMRSPRLIGGKTAPTIFEGDGVATVEDALRLKKTRHFSIGHDTVCEGYF